MAAHLRERDALLGLVGDVMPLLDLARFRRRVLRAVVQAVPADWISLNEFSPSGFIASIVEPEPEPPWLDVFARFSHENPLYQRYVRTRDPRVYRFSDVVTRDELEATALFREFYRPLGINHQIAFCLPSAGGSVLAIALSRNEHDFSGDERDFLEEARPFLTQAYLNVLTYEEALAANAGPLHEALVAAGLTPREAEVLRLVTLGAADRDIARHLAVSERTVQKHLERAFRKLDVSGRAAAAARVWELTRE